MEIYLTKMILDPRSRRVRRDVGNCQQLHRTISKAFPETGEETTPRQKYGILYRLETDNRRGRIVLLVQSNAKPDWRNLDENYLAEDAEDNLASKSIGAIYSKIESGMNLLFRLQANPTKRVGKSDTKADAKYKPSADKKIRRRVELRTDEEKIGWLKRKGEDAGFRLTNVKIKDDVENVGMIANAKQSGSKENEKDKENPHRLTFGSVVFEGVLQVTDADKLRESLVQGIGSGKAYGFGLLSIAPVKEN